MLRETAKRTAKFALSFLPSYLVDQLLFETRVSFQSRITRAGNRRKARIEGPIRANVGCGTRPTRGWINLDISKDPGLIFWDCRKNLPFHDATVEAIYSEHFFEHLDLETEAKPFLRECMRCLRPGGVLRLVVPDAGAYLAMYGGSWDGLAAVRPLRKNGSGYYDHWLDSSYATQMQFMNAIFRQKGEHKYAYDAETLSLMLREAGFTRITQQQYGVSLDPKMAPDSLDRSAESLYVEAVKD